MPPRRPAPGGGTVTGKPLSLGGSQGRADATSLACIHRPAGLERAGIDPRDATAAVHGFGKVGRERLSSWRERECAWSPSPTCAGESARVGPRSRRARRATSTARAASSEWPHDADAVTAADVLTEAVDLLIPAAVEGVITHENVDRVRARVIVEGANGPITSTAETALRHRGIDVVPDLLANGGGVVVSYFEWVQARQGWWWDAADVEQRLTQRMRASWQLVAQRASADGVDLAQPPRRSPWNGSPRPCGRAGRRAEPQITADTAVRSAGEVGFVEAVDALDARLACGLRVARADDLHELRAVGDAALQEGLRIAVGGDAPAHEVGHGVADDAAAHAIRLFAAASRMVSWNARTSFG